MTTTINQYFSLFITCALGLCLMSFINGIVLVGIGLVLWGFSLVVARVYITIKYRNMDTLEMVEIVAQAII